MKVRGIQTVLAQVDNQGQALAEPQMAVREENSILEIFLYDNIQPDEYDWWTGEKIEHSNAASFQRALDKHPDAKEIRLYVNSQGGYVREAMGIRAHLLRHKAHKVAYVDGWAASAASLVLTACDEIKMLTGSMQMLHSMWIFAIGNATELRKAADDLDRMMEANREVYLERAGGKLTKEKLLQIMDEERWLTPSECVELGLADQAISSTDYTKEAPGQRAEADETKPQTLGDMIASYRNEFGAMQEEREEPEEVAEPEPGTDPEPEQIEETDPQPDEPDPEPAQKEKPAQNLMAAFLTAVERTQNNA